MKRIINLYNSIKTVNYKTEVLSGLTVSLALIPEAIAFALIAGLSPLTGLYAAFTIGLVTSIFGGRPGMISGATGAIAVVIVAFAKSKGLNEYDCVNYTAKVTEEIKEEFAAVLAEHYFRIVSSAIRKYDKNHLMLGSRLNGRPRAIQAVVNASHKYMDVTSVNFYDRLTPDEQITLQSWTNNHPCLVGEFYTKDINAFDTPQSGTGFYVNSQTDRGKFYQNTCLQLLRNKCFIGWHYFRFIDNADSNKGIVNMQKKEYTEMTKYMRELNYNVYRICNYYDKKH